MRAKHDSKNRKGIVPSGARLARALIIPALSLTLATAETLEANPATDLFTAAQLSLAQAQSATTPEGAKVEYLSAETWLSKFLTSYPKDPKAAEATYLLAVTQSQLGKPKEAIASYSNFLKYKKTGKKTGVAALQVALNQYDQKDYEAATLSLSTAINNLPEGKQKTLAHYTRALCQQFTSERGSSFREDLTTVLNDKDGIQYHENAQFLLAGDWLRAGELDRAYELYKNGVKSKNPSVKHQSLLKCTTLAQKLGKTSEAIFFSGLTLKADALKEHHPSSALLLINAAAQEQDWKNVVAYEKYGSNGLSNELKVKRNFILGQAFRQLNQPQKATKYMDMVIQEAIGTPLAFEAEYLKLSQFTAEKLDRRAAAIFLQTYEETYVDDARMEHIKLLVAESDFANKKYADAIASYNNLRPDLLADENLPTIGHRLIQCYLKLGRKDQAAPLIDNFINKFPDDQRTPYLMYDKSVSLAEKGNNQGAITTLENLLKKAGLETTLSHPAEQLLAQLYFKTDNYVNAEKTYAKIYKNHKGSKADNADWSFMLACSQFKQDKFPNALTHFLTSRKHDAGYRDAERSNFIALCAYNLKDASALEKELKHHQSQQHNSTLPSPLYLFVALNHYKNQGYKNAWWSFQRAIQPAAPESYRDLAPSVMEAYVKCAIENQKYPEARAISAHLKPLIDDPFRKAENYYHSAVATYYGAGGADRLPAAQKDIDEAMRINPSGDLKYKVIFLAGCIEIDLDEVANGTRLLKQVILLSPKNHDALKVDALKKLIAHTEQSTAPEKEKLLEEYKKELEKLQ